MEERVCLFTWKQNDKNSYNPIWFRTHSYQCLSDVLIIWFLCSIKQACNGQQQKLFDGTPFFYSTVWLEKLYLWNSAFYTKTISLLPYAWYFTWILNFLQQLLCCLNCIQFVQAKIQDVGLSLA